jgi:hypothetical protein
MRPVIAMAVASERFVHFLVDLNGKPPQRCRVSFAALDILEGASILKAHRDQSMRLFMKHRRLIEAVARRKVLLATEKAKWIIYCGRGLGPTPMRRETGLIEFES